MPSTPMRVALSVFLLGSAAACSSKDRAQTTDSTPAGTTASATGGDSAHAAAMGGMHEDTLAAKVESYLRQLSTSNPDSLRALVPADREVVTALIADCEQMMRQMKVDPPRKWRSAVQDLRQDLARMTSMTGEQLQHAMPEHRKRIEGMLAMRRDMMRM
jgi:type IV pilus biogenesis protein CpaD/CtpE